MAIAFLGAGIVNVLGRPSMQASFEAWGYLRWWCWPTGALEIVSAALIAVPVTRTTGLVLGSVIILAALVTVLSHRDYGHLRPIGLFVLLIVLPGLF